MSLVLFIIIGLMVLNLNNVCMLGLCLKHTLSRLGLSFCLLSLTACSQSDVQKKQSAENKLVKDQREKTEKKERAIPVEVHRLSLGTVRATVKAVSILSPKEKASVRSLISGLVTELYVEEGDQVKPKQKLALITRPGAKSLIRKAASLYRKAKHDVKQLQNLVKKGLAPREELTQAKFNRDQTAIELTRLQEEAKNEILRSPIAGVVVNRPLYRGETVSPGQVIFEVMDLSNIYAPLNLPDRWSTKITEGMTAQLFDREGTLLSAQAHVSHVSPVIDANTGTFSVWVSPDTQATRKSTQKKKGKSKRSKMKAQKEPNNPHKSKLKPGLFVSAEITLGEHKDVLVIPREAVIYKDGQAQVAVVRNDRITLVNVEIGYQESKVLELVSPLKLGDVVVTFGQRGLDTGALIKPIWPKGLTIEKDQNAKQGDRIPNQLKR